MATVDRTGPLAALIRAQLPVQPVRERQTADTAQGPGATERQPFARAPSPQRRAPSSTDITTDAWVTQGVRGLSGEDPQRRRKAFRLFLESTLARELGTQRMGGIGFDQMVEQVLQQMESDPDLRTAMDDAAQILLSENAVSDRP